MNIQQNKSKLALLALFISAGMLSSCGPDKKQQAEQAEAVRQEDAVETPTVKLVSVEKGKLSSTIAVPGELLPYQQVDLYAKVNSYVKKMQAHSHAYSSNRPFILPAKPLTIVC